MRLKRQLTHNFRSIADSVIDYGDFTLFAGPQGSGKSSHLHALCAVLTGRTPHTDRRGAGIKEQIRRDQAKAEIELGCQFYESQPDTVVKRTITQTGQTLDVPWGKNLTSRQAILTERMGGVDEVPDVLLDPRLFADRAVDEQKQALLKLLRPPTLVVPDAARLVGIQSLGSVQQVDDHIKSLKDGSLRALNAVIKNLEETMPAEPTADELESARQAEQGLVELDARIQSLALEVQKAETDLDEARKRAREVESALALSTELPSLRRQREELMADETRAKNLSDSLAALNRELAIARESAAKVQAAKEAATKLPELRKSLDEARAEWQRCSSDFTQLSDRINLVNREQAKWLGEGNAATLQIDIIEQISAKCPTCSRKLSEASKQEILKSLRKAKEEAETKAQTLWQEVESLEKQRDEAKENGIKGRKEFDRLTQAIADAERTAADANLEPASQEEIQAKINSDHVELSALKQKWQYEDGGPFLPTLRVKCDLVVGEIAAAEQAEKQLAKPQPNIEELKANSADLMFQMSAQQQHCEATKQAAESARDTLRRAEDHKRIGGELTGHRAKREQYLAAVESLQTVKNSILGGESAKRLESMTSTLFASFFPNAHVILSPEGALVAPIGSNDGTPVAHLSSGQKVVFDMALRIAAAKTTGFNLLAMDDANKLAPNARDLMLKCLQASGCQVIMCTTADRVGTIPGAAVYQVSSPSVWGPTKVERVNGK